MKDFAPSIYRQRLVIEGCPKSKISDEEICDYLKQLGSELDMKVLTDPVTHRSDKFGWAGWVHWETSGAHFYAWEKPKLFFSVDIYTCKPFKPLTAKCYTQNFFKTKEIVFRSF